MGECKHLLVEAWCVLCTYGTGARGRRAMLRANLHVEPLRSTEDFDRFDDHPVRLDRASVSVDGTVMLEPRGAWPASRIPLLRGRPRRRVRTLGDPFAETDARWSDDRATVEDHGEHQWWSGDVIDQLDQWGRPVGWKPSRWAQFSKSVR